MKKILFLLTLLVTSLALSGCKENEVKLQITNVGGADGIVNTVEIDLSQLGEVYSNGGYLIVEGREGEIIPSQITYDDKLIFQLSLQPKQSTTLVVKSSSEEPQFESKVGGRLVPERKDDWAWESDKIAYRIYGPALAATGEISNGLDIWVKSTDKLIIDKWYESGDYHKDHGEGLDGYKVGRTLGAGVLSPLHEGKFDLGMNFASGETLDNGPIRYTFKVEYNPQKLHEAVVVESRTISLDASSHFNKVVTEFKSAKDGVEFPAAIGVVTSKGGVLNSSPRMMTYSERNHPKNGVTHIGVITLEDINKVETIQEHAAIPMTVKTNKPVTFYTGAGWSKHGFKSSASWERYVSKVANTVANPYKVEIIK